MSLFQGISSLGGGTSIGGTSIGSLIGYLKVDSSQWSAGLSLAEKQLVSFTAKSDVMFSKHSASIGRVGRQMAVFGAAVVGSVGVMVKSYGNFERAMRRGTAVSDVTEKQFVKMSKMAEKAAMSLNISATRAATAFYYLGSAGLSAKEQMQAFPSIALLSKAAVVDMGNAAEMVVDTIKGFQLDFADTGRVADIMTEAVISSNMTFSHLGESLSLVASIARTANSSLEETTAMLGLMANAGIKGSRAGTALRRAFVNLMSPASEVRKVMQQWNIEVYNSTGQMKNYTTLVVEIGQALRGASEEQKNFVFETLFGVRALTGQLAIFDLGAAAVKRYVKRIQDAADVTQEVADKQMMSFLEQLGKISQVSLTVARHIGEKLVPAVTKLGKSFHKASLSMLDWVDTYTDVTKALVIGAAALGITAIAVGGVAASLANLALVANGFGITLTALTLGVGAVTLGIGILVTTIAYLVIKIGKLKKESEELNKMIKETEDGVDDTIKKWEEYTEALRKAGIAERDLARATVTFNKFLKEREEILWDLKKLTAIVKDPGGPFTFEGARQKKAIHEMNVKYGVKEGFIEMTGSAIARLQTHLVSMLENLNFALKYMEDEAVETVETLDKANDKSLENMEQKTSWYTNAVKMYHNNLRESFKDFADYTATVFSEVISGLDDEFSDFFYDIIEGTETIEDAFGNLLENMKKMLTRFISDMAAKNMMIALFGESYGTEVGNNGGLSGAIQNYLRGNTGGTTTDTTTPSREGFMTDSQVQHSGGKIGRFSSRNRRVPASLYGGIGNLNRLGSNEYPAILRDGETVNKDGNAGGGLVINNELKLINNSSQELAATKQSSKMEPGKIITTYLLTDSKTNGPLKRSGVIG